MEPMAWSVSDPMTIRYGAVRGSSLLQIPHGLLRPELDEIGPRIPTDANMSFLPPTGTDRLTTTFFPLIPMDFCVPASYTISNRIPPIVSASG